MVSEGPDVARLTAEWARLGKHPGRSMGYEVLAGSLPNDRAQRYLWSATTGTPDSRDPASDLPWRVFLSGASGDTASVCAMVDTTWDGSRDPVGRASYTWRLTLLEWPAASQAGLTWTSLHQAACTEPPDDAPVTVAAARTPVTDLAGAIDEVGFAWAAGMAALLLDGRYLVITPPATGRLPEVDARVRLLDGICALLPYGCRTWLSGATWTGKAEHTLRLVFAAAARTGQHEVPYGASRPPAPQGETARAYHAELLRVRAKLESTAKLISHLLAATTAIPLRKGETALRILRELDLLDSVVEDVRQGRGRLADVRRLLDRYPAESLDDGRLRVLAAFLAGRAAQPDGRPALELLGRHYTPRMATLLADDVVARPASRETIALARTYLRVLGDLAPGHPEAFDELFTAMASTPGYDPGWIGSLAYMVENEFGRTSVAVDRILVNSPGAGTAWLRSLLANRTQDLRPLSRMVALSATDPVDHRPGWLRFAGVLMGQSGPEQAVATDAAEFTAVSPDAWRIVLETARQLGRPAVVSLMWAVLQQAIRDGGQAEVLPLLESVAPPGDPGLPPAVAADADLLRVVADVSGIGPRLTLTMPRLRRLAADDTALDAYTDILVRRVEGSPELRERVVETLLGDEPDPGASWAVLTRWIERRPLLDSIVLDLLVQRLTSPDADRWLDLELPPHLEDSLVVRRNLSWLRPVRQLRAAANAQATYGEMARIIATACPTRSYPDHLLHEIATLMSRRGAWFAFNLTWSMDEELPNLGMACYQALSRNSRYREVRDELVRFNARLESHHHQICRALGATDTGFTALPSGPPTAFARPMVPAPGVPPAPPAPPALPDGGPGLQQPGYQQPGYGPEPVPGEKHGLRDRLPWNKKRRQP